MSRPLAGCWIVIAILFVSIGCNRSNSAGGGGGGLFGGLTETREIIEYHPPKVEEDDGLADDRLADKHNEFDPELTDQRPLGDWQINQSEAVVQLDVPLAKPDTDDALLQLHASYAAAVSAMKDRRAGYGETLPSVNMVDGKAKQFDDGLYAALDQAYYRGLNERLRSHVDLVKRIFDRVGPDSPAAPFLAAGLKLAKQDAEVADKAARDRWHDRFLSNPVASKPISFYTWNETLQDCWRFMRFFQHKFNESDPAATAILAALADDSTLLADYQQVATFYARLTNPLNCFSFADLVGVEPLTNDHLKELRREKGIPKEGVALFPPSTSREYVLFDKLFGNGLPPNANLMRELVSRIRSGEVDLTPRENSGWYDHQVYALETLLLAEKSEEHNKLALTKSYKKRMLEAFKALITKRRETHARQMDMAMAPMSAVPMREKPETVEPRLRVEPCPSYFLRTARAYSFLHNFLESSIGHDTLAALHGLRATGERPDDLASELVSMRDLFYGMYLVSCEDIGHKPALRDGEVDSPDRCYESAVNWLSKSFEDPDLAQDTRVSVPIMVDLERNVTRLWITFGVRMTRLESRFLTPPRIKPKEGEGDWEPVAAHTLGMAQYLIPVDEFAEVELRGLTALTREELREICDRAKTKEAIIAALQKR